VNLRLPAILAACAAAIALVAAPADAGLPEGPRFAFTADPIESTDGNSLRSADPFGADVRVLGSALGARRSELIPELPIAWSPDGARLAVAGYRDGSIRIFIVNSTGGGYRLVPGSSGGIYPAFSPDGRTLAFTVSRPQFGSEIATDSAKDFDGTSIRAVDLATGRRRQLTPWRDGLTYATPSFSPDDSSLVATRVDERLSQEPEIVVIDLVTGRVRLLLRKSAFPVYAPDGSRIALLRQQSRTVARRRGRVREVEETTDLFTANSDGSGLRRLTRTPALNEFSPSWDPSGERLAYTVLPDDGGPAERPSRLAQVNADGSCGRTLRGDPDSNLYGAAWRPGAGREAGRISC
jgi:Tol biopolymer transport system component